MNDAIEKAKRQTLHGKDRLLKTLSFVPDDKLNWSPSPTAATALQIAAHAGLSNYRFIQQMRRQPMPTYATEAERLKAGADADADITTRQAAIDEIELATEEVLAFLDTLTDADVDSTVKLPFREVPMRHLMRRPGLHMEHHAGQIDYLQTCWGDMVWHF